MTCGLEELSISGCMILVWEIVNVCFYQVIGLKYDKLLRVGMKIAEG